MPLTRRRFLQTLPLALGIQPNSKAGASVINHGHYIFSGDFLASGKDQFLVYVLGSGTSAGIGSWLLGTIPFGGGPASWNPVANTETTVGDLSASWSSVGNFLGDGKDALLLYRLDSSDARWWLGTFEFGYSTQMSWTIANRTPSFGSLQGCIVWTGNFLGDGRDTLLLHDSNGDWWIGNFPFGSQQLSWTGAGNSNVADVDLLSEAVMLGDFVGNGKDALLLYSPKDQNWWLGAIPFGSNQMSWRTVGNWTNIIASTSYIWEGEFRVNGKTELLFYDDKYTWWLGSLAFTGDQISWQSVGPSPATNSLASFAFWAAWADNYFLGDDQWDLLMISPAGPLTRGTFGTSNDQISWIPVGNALAVIYAGAMGNFLGDGRTSMLWWQTTDANAWQLGTFTGDSMSWIPVLAPG
jgi:hypothetical protein